MTLPSPVLSSRDDFVADLGAAILEKRGYAAAKLGMSEQHWLNYPVFLATAPDTRALRAYELVLRHHLERQSGVFPSDLEFTRRFVAEFAEATRGLDCIGLSGIPSEAGMITHHRLAGRFVQYTDQEPDRSQPSDDARCYLRHLRGRRLLLIAPFADLLKERACRKTFEGVWARTGKLWFEPESVESIEFPYGVDRRTRDRFPTVLDLRDQVLARVDALEFDVALIGAAALGIPFASHIRRSGRVAISLGGHLQALFGVIGRRWRNDPWYRDRYFNDAWIDMPERYRPQGWENLCDGGAYW